MLFWLQTAVSRRRSPLAGMLATASLILTIHTTGTEAADKRRFCVLDFQIFGTGAGVLCEAPAGVAVVVDTACQAFEPLRYSLKTDSAETVRQAREHNAAWDELCGKGDD